MATRSDISRWGQIVALALEQGQSRDVIDARLERAGLEIGSREWTAALDAGTTAYEFGRAINEGRMADAEAQLAHMRASGAESVVLMGRMVAYSESRPVDREGRPVYTYRRFKDIVPITQTAQQIADYAEGFAAGMASGTGHDTPGYGDFVGVELEFGAPQ